MATQYTHDNEPFIVEPVLSSICWKEYKHKQREFAYSNLVRTIKLLKSGRIVARRQDYSEAVTAALTQLRIPEAEWTTIRALVSEYFKRIKDAKLHHPLADKHWEIFTNDRTCEISLYHPTSMTCSQSRYTLNSFELGSVTVEGYVCRSKKWIELHRMMGQKVTYEIQTGRR